MTHNVQIKRLLQEKEKNIFYRRIQPATTTFLFSFEPQIWYCGPNGWTL